MTEKEKRDSGLFYNNNHDKSLIDERVYCQKLCHEHNMTCPTD